MLLLCEQKLRPGLAPEKSAPAAQGVDLAKVRVAGL